MGVCEREKDERGDKFLIESKDRTRMAGWLGHMAALYLKRLKVSADLHCIAP